MKPRIFILALLLADAASVSAQTVEVKGLVSLFGQNWACFSQAANPNQAGFMLAEGETRGDVKLLKMDAISGLVLISDHGQVHTLRVRAASAVLPPANWRTGSLAGGVGGSAADEGSVGSSATDMGEQYQKMAGNPGWGTIPVAHSRVNSGDSSSGVQDGSANTLNDQKSSTSGKALSGQDNYNGLLMDTSGSDGTTRTADPTKAYWYQESLEIERSRVESTTAVLAGEATPWPRTPLTPPGTDPRLIGRETFFGSHIRGYIEPGFLND